MPSPVGPREPGVAPRSTLARVVAWTSGLAMLALLLRHGWEVVGSAAGAATATAVAVVAVAVSVAADLAVVRRAASWRAALWTLAPETALLLPILLLAGRPGLWALAVFARQALVVARLAARTRRYRNYADWLQTSPAKVLVISFLLLVAIGSVLLTFPRATTDGRGASVTDAVFTSTSATCVTGLATLNTVADAHAAPQRQTFTRFGQLVILVLIQLGGLGIMTLSAATLVLVGKRLGLRSRALMQTLLDEDSAAALREAFRGIVVMTLAIEALGAAALWARFSALGHPADEAAWLGTFHAISAFCNAGFSLFGDSLSSFRGDLIVNAVHGALIVLGGLGFGVITAVFARGTWVGPGRGWRRLSLQVRLVVAMTAALIVAGTILTFFLEYDASLRGLPIHDKLLASLFQSITLRTAGFNTVDLSELGRPMLIFACLFMFVGGSPGSTAGGIKTTTLGVLVATVRASLTGRARVEIGRRTVGAAVVTRAISIASMATLFLLTGLVLLVATQAHLPLDALLFETVSALGTVGLSLGVTPELTEPGKLIVVALMFVGRLGPLTIALAVSERHDSGDVAYPEGRVVVG